VGGERFLAAVRKAREQQLIGNDAAEKLRLLAGVYYCKECKKEHRTESAQGKAHLRLAPAEAEPAATVAEPKRGAAPKGKRASEGKPLPVALVEGAKETGAKARVKLRREAPMPAKRAPPKPKRKGKR
jgi:hypothetical protein